MEPDESTGADEVLGRMATASQRPVASSKALLSARCV